MSKIAKTTIILMIITILSKVLGFVKELILSSFYGASMYSDIYILTSSIPTTIFAGIGLALSTTFIPMYYEVESKNKDKYLFTNNITNIIFLLSILLLIIVFIFSENIIKIFAIGFKGKQLSLAVEFLRIMVIGIPFIGLSNIMTGFLQAENDFITPSIILIPYNIIIVFSILLSLNNIYFLPIGTLIAILSQIFIQLPSILKKNYKYKIYIDIKDEYIKKMIWLVMPVFIGVGVNQINSMVDKTLASTLVEGSISALNYANKLNGFVMSLFITTISTVIYPILSKLSIKDNKEKFTNYAVQSVNSVILLVTPVSVGAIVLAKPIVKLLFQRGEFDDRATSITAIALTMYSIGMIGFALRDILGKIFYSIQDTKTPMINGAIAMGVNIVLNIILVKYLEIAGLALATSLSSILSIFLLFKSLKKKIGDFGKDKIVKVTIKSVLASTIMGIVTYFSYNLLLNILGIGFIQEVIVLFISTLIGAIVYGILIIVLKIEEVNLITNKIKNNLCS